VSPQKQSGFINNISKQLSFETKKIGWVMTLTLIHRKMFGVGGLPVMTFGNCVLKTGMINWRLKLRTFLRFFTFLHFFQNCF